MIVLDPGEEVTCTFENEPRSEFTISFNSLPSTAVTEALVTCRQGGENLKDEETLSDGESTAPDFTNLPVGTYTCTVVIQGLTP